MGDSTEKFPPHALVVPWAGQGHVSGCMLLARALAALGFKVTFVYFSSFYAKLKESNRLVLPYSSCTARQGGDDSQSNNYGSSTTDEAAVKGLIEVRVVEDGFAPGDVNNPFFVTPTMKENLFNLILELREHSLPPTCLVSDSFVPWTLHVAERAQIPRVDFWTANALGYILMINLPPLFSKGIFPETGSSMQWKRETPLMLDIIPGLPPLPSEIYPSSLRFADPSHPWVSFSTEVSSTAKYGERILIHTMPAIEAETLRAFQIAGMPAAYGIGPLLQYYSDIPQKHMPAPSQAEGIAGVIGEADSISWLNTQVESSVIYVAFGSNESLSAEKIEELAFGLEASGSPFLWAFKEEAVEDGKPTAQALPKAFLERTNKRGLVMSWAPQMEVLAHKAIGGFLTHCGWNSSLESLWQGVPLLCCPWTADQRLNLHNLCNVWGVGLELERTETGGLHREFVERGVKALMREEVGLKAKGKAQQMRQLARTTCQPGGHSHSNLQKFYHDMKLLCSKSTSLD